MARREKSKAAMQSRGMRRSRHQRRDAPAARGPDPNRYARKREGCTNKNPAGRGTCPTNTEPKGEMCGHTRDARKRPGRGGAWTEGGEAACRGHGHGRVRGESRLGADTVGVRCGTHRRSQAPRPGRHGGSRGREHFGARSLSPLGQRIYLLLLSPVATKTHTLAEGGHGSTHLANATTSPVALYQESGRAPPLLGALLLRRRRRVQQWNGRATCSTSCPTAWTSTR